MKLVSGFGKNYKSNMVQETHIQNNILV